MGKIMTARGRQTIVSDAASVELPTKSQSEMDRFVRTALPPNDTVLGYLDSVSRGGEKAPQNAEQVGVVVRYLLVFEKPRHVLPTPVLHNAVLGRSSTADVSLKHDQYVGNRHCRFEILRDHATCDYALYVEDLSSRNGTFVNNQRIEEGKMIRLQHGNRLRVGETVCIVVQVPY
jgi:hypothetical protein